jgi:hypothetical protein
MIKAKKKPIPPKKRQTYSLDEKANAKRLYLIGLTLLEVSKVVGAPVRTVEKWQISNNWKRERETTAVHQKALDMFNNGKTQSEISKTLNKSVPTIARYIKKARNENEKK